MRNSLNFIQAGFSCFEALLVVAISATLATHAVPALDQLKQKANVELRAQSLMTDLKQARSESVMVSAPHHIRFSQTAEGSCYVVHSGSENSCNCTANGQAACIGDGHALRHEWVPISARVSIRSNVSSMSFHARQGTVTSTGSIDIVSPAGAGVRHIISIAGRVRSCAISGNFNHLPACA